jgi:hypothetical protein
MARPEAMAAQAISTIWLGPAEELSPNKLTETESSRISEITGIRASINDGSLTEVIAYVTLL